MSEQELPKNCKMSEDEIQDVLANIKITPAEKLFYGYIKQGCITVETMMETGNLDAPKRLKIRELEEEEKKKDEAAWNEADNKKDLIAYHNYLNIYPNGIYSNLAKARIKEIKKIEGDKAIEKEKLLEDIKNRPNDFTPYQINTLIRDGKISETDLLNKGFDEEIVKAIQTLKEPTLRLGEVPSEIAPGFTEVYFWGMPSSGKTCALSGILSHANKKGLLETKSGEGFHYMNQLKNIFSREIGFLPSATNVEKTQYLPFHLKDDAGKKHPIALIELAGEIFKCFYKIEGKIELDHHLLNTINTVQKYLNGSNRKVHFFVVDLDRDPTEIDGDSVSQEDYLYAAQIYFTANKIFEKSTDAIYIIATKSDTLKCSPQEQEDKSEELLMLNYPSFIETLKDVCEDKKNGLSKLKFIPFSMGEVYFNKICRFNPSSSAEIIEILQLKTGKIQKKSWLINFLNR